MPFITKLEIKYFRSINNIDITFSSNYNVFTGENNTGKTNILKAISRLLQTKESHSNPHLDFDQELDKRKVDTNRLGNYDLLIHFNRKIADISIRKTPHTRTLLNQGSGALPLPHTMVYHQGQPVQDQWIHNTNIDSRIICLFLHNDMQPFQFITYLQEQLLNLVVFTSDIEVLKTLKRTSNNTVHTVLPNSLEYGNLSLFAQGAGKQFSIILELLEQIKNKVTESHKHLVLLFDEPERGLHPKWMQEFSDMLQSWAKENPDSISIFITTHSYHFLNFTDPSSNYLVSKIIDPSPVIKEHTVIEQDDSNQIFVKIMEALGHPYPNEQDVLKKIFATTKDKIFIIEGETDKQHIENCIELFPSELAPLFQEWEIVSADSASKIPALIQACKKLGKSQINGIVDNDPEGVSNQGKFLKVLPLKGTIEKNTHKPDNFTTEILTKKWKEFDSQRGNTELYDQYIKIEKEQWKAYLTKLVRSNPEEAKKYYKDLKDFLIETVFD